jgi:predicted Holliday junction resolvase-like endonuclease
MSVVRLFQDFRRIAGFCPCCGDVFRLSDAQLFYRTKPPRSPWDNLEDERAAYERARERLDRETERLQERARAAGRLEMERRLARVTTSFKKCGINVRDLKLLFHPVDYLSFTGLHARNCTGVELIDRAADSKVRERLQASIERTISNGNVSWCTVRIADDGQVRCS